MKNIGTKCLVVATMWASLSCAPLFSDMQSARLVGKNNVEITPGYSSVQFAREGQRESVGSFVGLQAGYGLSDKVDLRVRYEHYQYENEETNVFAFGPKIGLVKDRIAFYLPVGFAFGGFVQESSNSWQMHPTILFTLPIEPNKIEFNPSVKHIVSFCNDCYNPLFAFNLGAGLSSDLSKWAIRPEYGLLYNLNEKGHYENFSIGLSLNMSLLFKK